MLLYWRHYSLLASAELKSMNFYKWKLEKYVSIYLEGDVSSKQTVSQENEFCGRLWCEKNKDSCLGWRIFEDQSHFLTHDWTGALWQASPKRRMSDMLSITLKALTNKLKQESCFWVTTDACCTLNIVDMTHHWFHKKRNLITFYLICFWTANFLPYFKPI